MPLNDEDDIIRFLYVIELDEMRQVKPISSGRFRRLILNCSLNEDRIPDERLTKLMIDIDRQLNPF